MSTYAVLRTKSIQCGELIIESIRRVDIELIRQWRNSQMKVLRQSREVSIEEQEEYFSNNVWPEFQEQTPAQILFSIIDVAGTLKGYGGLVHIDWLNKRAEVSFLLNPEIEKKTADRSRIFRDFLGAMKEVAFCELQLRKLTTETFEFRTAIIADLESVGFLQEGYLEQQWLIDGAWVASLLHGIISTSTDAKRYLT